MTINKKGFTLAEVLISMVIIGIVMAVSIQTIKIVQASYTNLAYFEYNNIKQIAGEAIAGLTTRTFKDTSGEKISRVTVRKMIDGKNRTVITSKDKTFCNYIVALSNVSGSSVCADNNFYNVDMSSSEPKFKSINYEEPTFITSNGKRYYISKHVPSIAETADEESTDLSNEMDKRVSEIYGYRLVAVDLNGTRKPNIMEQVGQKIPDIVTFMIMDSGEIFPLGHTADNLTLSDGKIVIYMISKVRGYYFSEQTGRSTTPKDCNRKLKDDKGNPIDSCTFGVFDIKTGNNEKNAGSAVQSYRKAYCYSLGNSVGTSSYPKYCNNVTSSAETNICPPSSSPYAVDECRVQNVKPVFRYNM